jgi:hypothetical protein
MVIINMSSIPLKNIEQKHVYKLEVSHAWKQPRLQDLLPKTTTKTSLITNLNHEMKIIRTRTRTRHMQNKNTTRFYAKKK